MRLHYASALHAQGGHVEVHGGAAVGGQQFVPEHGAWLGFDPAANVLLGLPNGEVRSLGVLAHRHAPGLEHVHGAEDHRASVLPDSCGGLVDVVDVEVSVPVRRHVLAPLFFTLQVDGAGGKAVYFLHVVEPAGGNLLRVVFPAEEGTVEGERALFVGSVEFCPGRRSWRV